MSRSIADRLAALEARRGQRKPFAAVSMPEWSFSTASDKAAWRAEHVEPLQRTAGVVVVLRRLFLPVPLQMPESGQ